MLLLLQSIASDISAMVISRLSFLSNVSIRTALSTAGTI